MSKVTTLHLECLEDRVVLASNAFQALGAVAGTSGGLLSAFNPINVFMTGRQVAQGVINGTEKLAGGNNPLARVGADIGLVAQIIAATPAAVATFNASVALGG